jgi:DNA-binding transcriptional ArsR family regulator
VTKWSRIVNPVNDDAAQDLVFRALADPTRRALLDALFAHDGQTVQSLCRPFPEMTRFGVMKHLKVLEDAHLVIAHKVGREKRQFLNPVPIQHLADRWISKYAQPFTRALADLKTDLERTSAVNQ